VVSSFNEASLHQDFNSGQFDYELKKAHKSLDDLQKKFTLYKDGKNST
jgi:nitrogen fixation-related uncharacterized protein